MTKNIEQIKEELGLSAIECVSGIEGQKAMVTPDDANAAIDEVVQLLRGTCHRITRDAYEKLLGYAVPLDASDRCSSCFRLLYRDDAFCSGCGRKIVR